MNAFDFVAAWYRNHCDGDWEHQYGVHIGTIDNPGWEVRIDLAHTEMENLELGYKLIEISDSGWFGYSVKNKVFVGAGDPAKLEALLNAFKEIASQRPGGGC